ncbi:MAG TPA: SPOR domain-containing protein [Blastocatellia bacterium]|nr:SPOR domain-containing protein [Blastocatellia bacterium]
MQLEITIPLCPLCKQEALANTPGQVAPTRLCAACRSMVQTILPGRRALAEAYSVVEPASARAGASHLVDSLPHAGMLDTFPAERDFVEHGATIQEFAGQDFIELDESTTDLYECEEVEQSQPGYDDQSSLPADSALITDSPALDSAPQIDLLDDEPLSLSSFDEPVLAELPVAAADETWPEEAAQTTEIVPTETVEIFAARAAEPVEITPVETTPVEITAEIAVPREAYEEAQPAEQPVVDYKEAVDPWDDPLPAWDYSVNEYPTLLAPEPSTGNRGWMKLAAAVALVVIVGATGYLFLFKRSAVAVSEKAASVLPITEADAAKPIAQTSARPESRPAAESNASAAPGAPVSTQPVTAPVRAHLPEEGNYSLQAASLPNESAANEFAQKVARAGVEARVVAADLGRKGRWYRVRVGRFMTAAEAENFARTATANARAAGMNLQLMVCDYEKP